MAPVKTLQTWQLSVTTEWTGGCGFWAAPSHNTSWSTAVFAGRPHERKQHGLPFFNHTKTTTWVVKCGRLNGNKPESFVNKWDKWWLVSWLQYNMSTCEIVHLRVAPHVGATNSQKSSWQWISRCFQCGRACWTCFRGPGQWSRDHRNTGWLWCFSLDVHGEVPQNLPQWRI